MKKSILVLAVLSLLVSGCARRYQLTLHNGNRITTLGKPKLESGYYVFRDIQGRTNMVSESRVAVVEPAPRGYSEPEAPKPLKR